MNTDPRGVVWWQRLSPAWRKCLTRAPAAVGLMALIFIQSSRPGVLGDLGVFNLILSSAAHVAMFGALAAILWWVLRPVADRALLIAVGIAALYGASDEIHQAYVATRTASLADVGFDLLGAGIAALLIRRSGSHRGDGSRQESEPRPPAAPSVAGAATRRLTTSST